MIWSRLLCTFLLGVGLIAIGKAQEGKPVGPNVSVTCGGLTIATTGTCPDIFGFTNTSLVASVGSSILTVALKDATGADPSATSPSRICYRSATAATGSLTCNNQTAALSITTNAIGASLGSSNNAGFRLWVGTFDNAGTNVMWLYNASIATGCTGIDEGTVQSSIPISNTATTAATFYTPNGTTVTNKSVRILGYVEYNSTGLATAGTYASAPNFIQVLGLGGKKPCDSFGRQGVASNSQTAVTGTTYATTNMTKAITPHSAANLIWISGSGVLKTVTTNTNTLLRLRRAGSSIVDPIASANNVIPVTSNSAIMGNWMYLDTPNTTSSTTYDIQIKNDNAGGTSQLGDNSASQFQIMILEEIMGALEPANDNRAALVKVG